MENKLKAAVVFGGRTPEHTGSIESALYILAYIDINKYDVHAVYIKKDGKVALPVELAGLIPGFLSDDSISVFEEGKGIPEGFIERLKSFALLPEDHPKGQKSSFTEDLISNRYDVVFPVMHGRFGEDGTIQGMLEFLDVPYVGCGVLGSAIGLDKEIAKRVCMTHGIPIVDFEVVLKNQWQKNREECISKVEDSFGYPNFIKPANLGSSIGIARAKNREDLIEGIDRALELDGKILIEKALHIKEFGVGVIGNDFIETSLPAGYNSCNEFLDYEAKFGKDALDDDIPARLPKGDIEKLRDIAKKVYIALNLRGFSRVDIFIDDNHNFYFNEVNTIPGFGAHSVFAKMWEISGLSVTELINKMITLSLQK